MDGSGNAIDWAAQKGLKPGSKLMSAYNLGDWKVAAVREHCPKLRGLVSIAPSNVFSVNGLGGVVSPRLTSGSCGLRCCLFDGQWNSLRVPEKAGFELVG